MHAVILIHHLVFTVKLTEGDIFSIINGHNYLMIGVHKITQGRLEKQFICTFVI